MEDFRDTLNCLALVPEIIALEVHQINHVWSVTFQPLEGKRQALAIGDLNLKERSCVVVVDPGSRDVLIKLHRLLHYVPDDETRAALASYGTMAEVSTTKWRVQGVEGCASMTRAAAIRLKPWFSLDDLPHQLGIAGGQTLVVVPGRALLCPAPRRALVTFADTSGYRNVKPVIASVTTRPTASKPVPRRQVADRAAPTPST